MPDQLTSTLAIPEETKAPEVGKTPEKSVAQPIMSQGQKAAFSKILNSFKEEAKSSLEKIKEYERNIFENSEGKEGIKTQIDEFKTKIDTAHKDITEKCQKIDNLHKEIFSSTEENSSIEEDIKNIQEKFNNDYNLVEEKKEKLDSYYKKIFGEKGADGNVIGGLEKEINDKIIKLDELYKQKEVAYNTLFKKIESMLPGATSIGLAKAYEDQKKKFSLPNFFWTLLFVSSTSIMIYFGFTHVSDSKTFWEAVSRVFSKLPFFIPAIWLAAFASKQQSQNKRLAQEYAYKESLAKSFDGFKKQIDMLEQTEEHKAVLLKLVENLVLMTSSNPSMTLENKCHHDSPPLVERIFGLFGKGKREKE